MRFSFLLLSACSLLLFGCAGANSYLYRTTILDGQKVEVEISQKSGPVPARSGNLEVKAANFTVNADKKQLVYVLVLQDGDGRPPRRIKVEDVTDESAVLLVDDTNPKLTENIWRMLSEPMAFDDKRVKWVLTIDEGLRFYRFTVEKDNGQTVQLLQAGPAPAQIKAGIRNLMGLKY